MTTVKYRVNSRRLLRRILILNRYAPCDMPLVSQAKSTAGSSALLTLSLNPVSVVKGRRLRMNHCRYNRAQTRSPIPLLFPRVFDKQLERDDFRWELFSNRETLNVN